ncbi:conserved protein of unknown function [Cyanobium sp. NIES-981]|nr:conserved protein of unknown function [Cyanobium sp. NIES-981]
MTPPPPRQDDPAEGLSHDPDAMPQRQGLPLGLRILALLGALSFVMLGVNSLLPLLRWPPAPPPPPGPRQGPITSRPAIQQAHDSQQERDPRTLPVPAFRSPHPSRGSQRTHRGDSGTLAHGPIQATSRIDWDKRTGETS